MVKLSYPIFLISLFSFLNRSQESGYFDSIAPSFGSTMTPWREREREFPKGKSQCSSLTLKPGIPLL